MSEPNDEFCSGNREKTKTIIPPVIWAQRSHFIYLTFCVPEPKDPCVKIENEQITFTAVGGAADNHFELCIELYAPIDTLNSIWFSNGRCVKVELQKLLTDTKYWPRLTRNKVKYHWLKIDFAKWVNEEEEIELDEKMEFAKNARSIQPKSNITFSLGTVEDEDEENAKMTELQIDEWKMDD